MGNRKPVTVGRMAEDGSGFLDSPERVRKRHHEFEKGGKFFEDQTHNVKSIVNAKEGDRILDVGCFTGKFEAIFSHTCKVTGVDINKTALELARKHCRKKGNPKNCAFFLRTQPLDKMFRGKKFTKAMLIDSLEHMPDSSLKNTFKEIKPLVAKEGELLIYTPNRGYWSERLRDLGFDRAGRVGHINLKRPGELRGFVEASGFRVKELYLKPSASFLAPLEKALPLSFFKKRICLKAVKV